MNITVEELTWDLIDETEALIAKNYEETGQFHDPLDIDWRQYLSYGAGFVAFVMRNDEGIIVGVLFFVLATYPHIKTLIMAQQVTFYVEPEYRRYSLKMVEESEKLFRNHGVDLIIQVSRYGTRFTDVLSRRGYERTDITHIKRLT